MASGGPTGLAFSLQMYSMSSVSGSNRCGCTSQGLRVGLRIVDHDLDVHVAEVAAAEAFGQLHRVTVRMSEAIQPGLREADVGSRAATATLPGIQIKQRLDADDN